MEMASFLQEKDVHHDEAVVQSSRSEYPGLEKHLNQGIFLLANSRIRRRLSAMEPLLLTASLTAYTANKGDIP